MENHTEDEADGMNNPHNSSDVRLIELPVSLRSPFEFLMQTVTLTKALANSQAFKCESEVKHRNSLVFSPLSFFTLHHS